MAPVVKELNKLADQIDSKVIVTAQHRQMLDQVLELFSIYPEHDLNIMQQGQNLFDITRRALDGLGKILETEKPDLVLVHGDTTTTFAGALAAYYLQISVGHVEAGLRTGNKYSPFPEEMNRHLTGVLADMHFAPTAASAANLTREGVPEEKIFVTGNTVIDALRATVKDGYVFSQNSILSGIAYEQKRVILVTTHRRENLGEPLREVYRGIRQIAENYPDVEVVFPVHMNPAVRGPVQEELGNNPQIHLIEPLDYEPFVNLMNRCCLVLTDSGGMQEEAPSLGKPVLVLRDTTERPEALDAGTVCLIGCDRGKLVDMTANLLDNQNLYYKMANAVNPYGDGLAAERIVQAIKFKYGLTNKPPKKFIPA
jgi:UDP-N-acetylglucosamine 2-epimerase (non-hydrolysing)